MNIGIVFFRFQPLRSQRWTGRNGASLIRAEAKSGPFDWRGQFAYA